MTPTASAATTMMTATRMTTKNAATAIASARLKFEPGFGMIWDTKDSGWVG